MSTTQSNTQETVEQCEHCDAKTTHRVFVTIITESDSETNAEFSREPYRVTECVQCGTESRQRMNDV
ncbi:hypothetical protein [Haladaptatus sp.]|uniref:DUF7835 family putative zinc beta-ribbon protein n=1 Tax=Haladaptatus sp. TaxID=1973141 RepID=UPI003C5A77E4